MKRAVFLAAAAIAFFAATGTSLAAFGISPPFLNADHLVPGVTYDQTIYLVQDQPDTDLTIAATLDVPDSIKSWVAIDKGFTFVIPKGTRQFPVVVSIHVPKNQTLGKYSGNLVFATAPGATGQVTVSIGANVTINLTVGNDIFEKYSIPYIAFPPIEEGWNPKALVRFQNDGNVSEGIDSASFDLYDQYDAVRLAYVTKQGGFPETPAFTTSEYLVEFPTSFHLGVGDYWGSVVFYKGDKVIASQKTIFHVVPAGTLSPLGSLSTNLKNYWIYWTAGLLVLLFVVRWLWIRFSRRKTKGA